MNTQVFSNKIEAQHVATNEHGYELAMLMTMSNSIHLIDKRP